MPKLASVALCALLVATTTACSGDDGQPSKPSDPAATARCAPARPMQPTDKPQTFSHGGQQRSYLLFLPKGYDGTTRHPLVFGFHGFGGTKEVAEAVSQIGVKGPARGYIAVVPDSLGTPRQWNFGGDSHQADDFGFIDALVTDLSKRLCVDPDRIYAAGHSNGSAFTGFLQCKPPYRFAAVAMVSAFIPSTCPVGKATPSVLAVQGTADPGVPYNGGPVAGGPIQIPGVLTTLDSYRDHYSCTPRAVEDQPRSGVKRKAYGGCVNGAEAVLYSVVGGGHEWPTDRFAATDAILDFFDAHPRSHTTS